MWRTNHTNGNPIVPTLALGSPIEIPPLNTSIWHTHTGYCFHIVHKDDTDSTFCAQVTNTPTLLARTEQQLKTWSSWKIKAYPAIWRRALQTADGVKIREGTKIFKCYACANKDAQMQAYVWFDESLAMPSDPESWYSTPVKAMEARLVELRQSTLELEANIIWEKEHEV